VNVIIVGGLILSILHSLYSAQYNVKATASDVSSKVHINVNNAVKEATRAPESRHSHCAIVVSRLFGNHTERRRRLTLDWYRHVAVNSIRVAAEHSNMTAVMIVLHNTDSYADEVVNDTNTLGSIVSYFQLGGSVSMETPPYLEEVQRLATERQCQVMSVMRLDADDMLLPAAFQNIEMGWKGVMASNNCTSSSLDNDCPRALVSGVPFGEVLQYVLDPVASDGGMTCSVLPSKGRRWQQGDKLVTASLGVAVTMPKALWMSHFRGDIGFMFVNHLVFVTFMAEKMQTFNISTHFQNLSSNHAGWIETPLSGHYQARRRGQVNCTLPYLTQLIGKEGAEILWTNRRFIPRLTRDESESNIYFANSNTQKPAKKFNARKYAKIINRQRTLFH
jgi:hypothetical protein